MNVTKPITAAVGALAYLGQRATALPSLAKPNSVESLPSGATPLYYLSDTTVYPNPSPTLVFFKTPSPSSTPLSPPSTRRDFIPTLPGDVSNHPTLPGDVSNHPSETSSTPKSPPIPSSNPDQQFNVLVGILGGVSAVGFIWFGFSEIHRKMIEKNIGKLNYQGEDRPFGQMEDDLELGLMGEQVARNNNYSSPTTLQQLSPAKTRS